jgi:hypothetical protein
MNRPSKTYSRAPGWHGPNGYVGCTGDTLALPVRHAGAGAEPGGLAALAAHQAEGRAAGLVEETDQVVDGRRNAVDAVAAAVDAVDAGTDEGAEDVVVAVVAAAVAGQAAAVVAEDGVLSGGAAAIGRSIEVVVAVLGGHHEQVGRRADVI